MDMIRCAVWALVTFFGIGIARGALFEPGYYYSTGSGRSDLITYDSAGTILSRQTIPGLLSTNWGARGIAFGPDHLLYVVVPISSLNYEVRAFDAQGTLKATYPMSGSIIGSTLTGKITFDISGNFYVGDSGGLSRFVVGDPSETVRLWSSSLVNGVSALLNGNLLIADGYRLLEITPSGALVRTVTLSDPNLVAGDQTPPVHFADLCDVLYEPLSNTIYVAQLGYSGVSNFSYRVLRINLSGVLLAETYVADPNDLELTPDGKILVGNSRTAPKILTPDLTTTTYLFEGYGREYVAAFPSVPEPASWILIGSGLLLLTTRRIRSNM